MWAGLCSRFLVPEVIPEPQGWRWVSPIAGSALPHSLGPSPSLRQTTVAGAVLRDVPGAVAHGGSFSKEEQPQNLELTGQTQHGVSPCSAAPLLSPAAGTGSDRRAGRHTRGRLPG